MKNKNNLVIKVKYPTSEQNTETAVSESQVVTIWHFERIAAAIIAVVMFLALLLYFIFSNNSEEQPIKEQVHIQTPVQLTPVAEKNPTIIIPIAKPATAINTTAKPASAPKPAPIANIPKKTPKQHKPITKVIKKVPVKKPKPVKKRNIVVKKKPQNKKPAHKK